MLSVLKNQPLPRSVVQPPEKLTAYLRDALGDLKRRVDAHKPKSAASAATPTSAHYQNAIARWVATLTPVQRLRRYGMDEIVKLAGVEGANGKPASIQAMGVALYAGGFVQARDWTKAGRNRRYWKLKESA